MPATAALQLTSQASQMKKNEQKKNNPRKKLPQNGPQNLASFTLNCDIFNAVLSVCGAGTERVHECLLESLQT